MSKEHWNSIFHKTPEDKLGWYEKDIEQTLKFVNLIDDIENKTVFIAGAGTSQLVDYFVGKCKKLILNDISDKALSLLEIRLSDQQQEIEYIHSDLGVDLVIDNNTIDIWIDRAVLHFLLEEKSISTYFNNLNNKIKNNGYALLAEFSKDGAQKCAGLDLHRYSIEELTERIGHGFQLTHHESYTFINPFGGERPYIYSLFKKS